MRGNSRPSQVAGYVLTVGSDNLDPVVYVFGPTPADSLYDDDGGEGLNARLCLTPSQLEGHRIVVTAWDAENGTYTLSVNSDDGPECGATADPSSTQQEQPEVSAGEEAASDSPASDNDADVSVFSLLDARDRGVRVGESVEGSLTERDFLQGGGRRVQVWSLNAAEGQRFSGRSRFPLVHSFPLLRRPGARRWSPRRKRTARPEGHRRPRLAVLRDRP